MGVEDAGMTITQPYDTTSRTPIAAGARLTTNSTAGDPNLGELIDLINYDYLILQRVLTIPVYSIDTIAKGREEYQIASMIYYIFNIPTNEFRTIVNNQAFTTRSQTLPGTYISRALIWSSASALSLNTGLTYGVLQVPQAPSVSSSNRLIIKSPSILIRGNTTNLTSTFYNALTDVRAQFVIDVYRAPKGHLSVDGWSFLGEMQKLVDCTNATNRKLV